MPKIVSQAGHHGSSGSSSPPQGASSEQGLGEALLNSSLVLRGCRCGPAEGVRAGPAWLRQMTAFTPASSLLPGSLWGKVSARKNQTGWVRKQEEAREQLSLIPGLRVSGLPVETRGTARTAWDGWPGSVPTPGVRPACNVVPQERAASAAAVVVDANPF